MLETVKDIKGIPKSEKIWVKRISEGGGLYYTTSKIDDRSYYYLYKITDGKAVKIGKSKSPAELEEKYIDK